MYNEKKILEDNKYARCELSESMCKYKNSRKRLSIDTDDV